MEKYDYHEALKYDIKKYIIENEMTQYDGDYYDYIDSLNDILWDVDKVTGNGEFGYDSEEKCQEYVCTNLDLYFTAANEFSDFPNSGTQWIYDNPAIHMDTTIRCYLLRECIEAAVDEIKSENDD